jgi:MFS family permease
LHIFQYPCEKAFCLFFNFCFIMMAKKEVHVVPRSINAATVVEDSISLSLSDGSSVEHVSESSLQSNISRASSNGSNRSNGNNSNRSNGNSNGHDNYNGHSNSNGHNNNHGSPPGRTFQMLDTRRYSDYTIPTSNAGRLPPPLTASEREREGERQGDMALAVQAEIALTAAVNASHTHEGNATLHHRGSSSSSSSSSSDYEIITTTTSAAATAAALPKRSIFGTTVQKNYHVDDSGTAGAAWSDHPLERQEEQPQNQAANGDSLYQSAHNPNAAAAPENTATPTSSAASTPQRENYPGRNRFGLEDSASSQSPHIIRPLLRVISDKLMSPLTPSTSFGSFANPATLALRHQQQQQNRSSSSFQNFENAMDRTDKTPHSRTPNARTPQKRKQRVHENIHAQSLLLGLAFAAVWTPSNLMAPNLTEIAVDFGFDESQRDLYLGSYCALATGVLSFPIGAGIGILTDIVSRQRLFCFTVAGGALSAIATGFCQSYWQLFLARLLTGGFMSGSVPVAFSFLGDLFATEERNAASSGLTAMMGLGIILGQVYAGVVGSTAGWTHAFFVSGTGTMILAVLCLFLVQEPVRGGKEKALQDMLKAGTRYERKLTWKGFLHTVRHNESNTILLWQGFFSSLPWGIIFVFLNDYLSQERNFSVPDATFLVFLFGLGCAVGGILGGYLGQKVQAINRSYLPLFMSATTLLGILPFLGLLNSNFSSARGPRAMFFSISGGVIASLPAVNVRPVLINVNPPETRGASLTAANLLINLGRGIGPSCITLMGSIWHVDRKFAFNVTVRWFGRI